MEQIELFCSQKYTLRSHLIFNCRFNYFVRNWRNFEILYYFI